MDAWLDIINASGAGRTAPVTSLDFSTVGLQQTLHNGFEMWWLAGLPLALACGLTLLSLSLFSTLHKLQQSFVRRLFEGKSSTKLNEGLKIPRHIAVIMDGNRRYGKNRYGTGIKGHADGSRTLVNFVDWCQAAGVEALTVYAFSTENWNRDQKEIDALMNLFKEFMHRIIPEALRRNIRVQVLTSDSERFSSDIMEAIDSIESQTAHCTAFRLNICASYGSRSEIVRACQRITQDVVDGNTAIDQIDENLFSQKLLTKDLPEPELLLRTSGEQRLSNFLLYQAAYAELIFVPKNWPEFTQDDLTTVFREFTRRKRRFGK